VQALRRSAIRAAAVSLLLELSACTAESGSDYDDNEPKAPSSSARLRSVAAEWALGPVTI
jgi:hypothetical protein